MPTANLHHTHLFSSDIDATVDWWRRMLGAELAFDDMFGGARNVFLRVGSGRLHLYDQPPRDQGKGTVHHLGVQTDDLAALVAHMESGGVEFRAPSREFGTWRYVMVEAPDGVLLELFEADDTLAPPELAAYFRGN
jgi:catechol 2,3-dioxygenase-like lactoylglutathione lyase family enzyme